MIYTEAPSTMDEQASHWTEIALADYHARRTTILQFHQALDRTLTFGIAAVSILVTGAFNVWNDELLASVIFLVVIPLVTVMVLVVWTDHALRILRGSVYLSALERTLRGRNAALPRPFMAWEEWVSTTRSASWWWRVYPGASFAALVLLAVASIAMGTYRGYADHEVAVAAMAAVMSTLVLLAAFLLASQQVVGGRLLSAAFSDAFGDETQDDVAPLETP